LFTTKPPRSQDRPNRRAQDNDRVPERPVPSDSLAARAFPTEQSALKVLYLVIRSPIKNRANVTGKTPGWKKALNALALYYGDRITLN
jgi:hypothetical protein